MQVTLHVSVWVEILVENLFSFRNVSRSTWACELKYQCCDFVNDYMQSHAPRERVSWNFLKSRFFVFVWSHAPRERVSWNIHSLVEQPIIGTSRSTWACELKYYFYDLDKLTTSHAPRERVSWNTHINNVFKIFRVTLHVSVWVEILLWYTVLKKWKGHAPRERVSWNVKNFTKIANTPGHAPRERVSWNAVVTLIFEISAVTLHVSVWVEIKIFTIFTSAESHAPRERVSWNKRHFFLLPLNLCHAPRERVSWN